VTTRTSTRVGAGLLATAVVAAGVAVVVSQDSTAATARTTSTATGTATVERRDLVTTEDLEGELGFGEATTVSSAAAGVVTWVPKEGARVQPGQRLYAVDAEPTMLLRGSVPAYRDLDRGTEGPDVEQLETALRSMGYGSGLTVDEEYTSATARAVKEWEGDLDRDDPDGVVELGEVRFGTSAVRVESVTAGIGSQVQVGGAALEVTGTARVVAAQLAADRSGELPVGTTASLDLPGAAEATGTVRAIGTEVHEDASNPDADPTVDVTITLDDASAAAGLDNGAVTATVERSRTDDVLAVPVPALLALAGGGYALEVRGRGGASTLVAVKVGTVAGGWAEVDGVDEGTTVAVAE
jgi:hypothetical protein